MVNIAIGLVRMKVVAVLLGPAGVGLIGLLNNLVGTAASVAALGTGTVGTRQIAEAVGRGDAFAMVVARRALFWGTLALAAIGSLVFWLLRDTLAIHALGDPALSNEVGWLALGVGLTVAGGSQGALLTGLRRISDLARASVWSAIIATVLGIGALLLWHEKGLVVYLLITPVAGFLAGHWYVRRLPKLPVSPTPLRLLTHQWRRLAQLGLAFMVAGLAATLGQLMVRTLVQRNLGTDAVGYFEASWVISMTYIGFVLRAMGTDYYPRLTAAIHDHAAVNALVNQQTEVALLLAGPVFLAMIGVAPWIVELLYSDKFAEAATVLRWQILGDILKIVSWPLGFVILAAGDGRTFMATETSVVVMFVLCVWLGIPYLGLQATGLGFLIMYACLLPLVYCLVRRKTGFRWTRSVLVHMTTLLVVGVLVSVAAAAGTWPGAILGLITACAFGFHALRRLSQLTSLPGKVAALTTLYQKVSRIFR